MRRFWFRRALRFLTFGLLFAGVIGYVVMSLWNALLPSILGVSAIGFWQALGLLLLSRILFGGPRGYGWNRGGFGPDRRVWKQKMTDHWKQMTPEQRDKMRQQWRERCGRWGRGRWESNPFDQSDDKGPTPL